MPETTKQNNTQGLPSSPDDLPVLPSMWNLPLQPAERYAPAPHPRRNAPARSFSPAVTVPGASRCRAAAAEALGREDPLPAALGQHLLLPPPPRRRHLPRHRDPRRDGRTARHRPRRTTKDRAGARCPAGGGAPEPAALHGSFSGARWLRVCGWVRVGRSCRRSVSRS